MTASENDIAERIRGRRLGEEAGALVISELPETEPARQAFVEALLRVLDDMIPKPAPTPTRERMTAEQARMFERSLIPWGIHAGQSVGWVAENDFGYLRYVTQEDDFKALLRRYVDSGHGEPDCED